MDVAFPWDPLEYPFEVPDHSFRWSAGGIEATSPSGPIDEMCAGRQPVLAIGSNASPGQLDRKFNAAAFGDPARPDGSIPVLRAEAADVDVVYGAHVAPYGALPATLLDTPGARCHIFVTWLTPRQLDRMNETEGLGQAYRLRPVDQVLCHGERVASALSYVTMAGACLLDGSPLGLATISAPGSPRPRGTERQAWNGLAQDMDLDVDGEILLHRVLGSSSWRGRVEAHLDGHRMMDQPGPGDL